MKIWHVADDNTVFPVLIRGRESDIVRSPFDGFILE